MTSQTLSSCVSPGKLRKATVLSGTIPDPNATFGWVLGLPIDEHFTSPSGQACQMADKSQPTDSMCCS
ncbi:MAG: hypothetical protein WD738_04885 [Pirellulales bacterium]